MLFNLLCHLCRLTGLLRLTKKSLILSIFKRLDPLPQVFRQVKKWIMFELHKIIRISYVVSRPIVFILF